ncbi:MAG: thiamine pyrophosphate-binding protein [Rhodospirillaceae bacterium]|nr:thiamine pyrophosphate-binding protein [Rhodospirillaceae bacterium]
MTNPSTPSPASKTNRLNGGQVIARTLAKTGARTAFCLAGTAHTHLLFGLQDEKFRIVSGRHETGTVAAADGYARITGKVGIALIKADQGLPNAMTGIITAHLACSPVVVIVSLTPANTLEAEGEDENDALDMVKAHCKWARTVPMPERLAEFVEAALAQATAGRPGVAVLGVPQDFEAAAIDYAERANAKSLKADPPAADVTSINAAADLIANAKRPMIVAGSGAALAGAGAALRNLARTFKIPVLASNLGRGLVPEDMKLGFAWPLAQVAAKEADVVLIVGLRMSQRMGYGLAPRFAANAKFIQVDIDAAEIGHNRLVDVPIVADARVAIEQLHAALTARKYTPTSDPVWVNDAMKVRLARIDELGRGETAPIHPYRMARDLMAQMPENAIYVGDGADIQNWMHAILRIRSERAFMDHYPLGSMGIGTPLALGAAAAARELAEDTGDTERPVVLVTGDGSFGFYCCELNGAALAGLKIVCLISNDGAWGTEKHGQANALGKSINCELGQWDYQLIAKAYGLNGERIERPEDIAPALRRAFAADKTTVLNVITDPAAGLVRKQDPRVQTVAFEDLVSSQKKHYTPAIA